MSFYGQAPDRFGLRGRTADCGGQEAGQYLGHPPPACLMTTRPCVYPKGHGKGGIVFKRSTDGGIWATAADAGELGHQPRGPHPAPHQRSGGRRQALLMFSGLAPPWPAATTTARLGPNLAHRRLGRSWPWPPTPSARTAAWWCGATTTDASCPRRLPDPGFHVPSGKQRWWALLGTAPSHRTPSGPRSV